jgi:hypothetical protein
MTLADRAISSLKSFGFAAPDARACVNAILDGVTNPDAEMIEAGLVELNAAWGKPKDHNARVYRRQLVVTIYQAMLHRARL